ncbi:MAG: amidase [Ignavibacteria bacterium]
MAPVPTISVGILTRREIRVSLLGRYRWERTGELLAGEIRATADDGGITLCIEGKHVHTAAPVILLPTGNDATFVLHDVTIGVQFHWQQNEDQRFAGALRFLRTGAELTAVNVVDIEHYLTSVISSEMGAESSLAFLQAHAVTSRSWLLAQLETSRARKAASVLPQPLLETETERIRWYDREDHEHFDVCADDHCQRYQGGTKVSTATVTNAVESTRGLVLTHDGKVCDARFSKCCGGLTEPFENVWEPVHHPYLVSIVDAVDPAAALAGVSLPLENEANAERWMHASPPVLCNTHGTESIAHVLPDFDRATRDFFRWHVTYTQDELAALIARKSGRDVGHVVRLAPRRRGPSGRLIELTIVGTKGTFTIGKELEIRRTLSPTHLYSSAFVVETGTVKHGVPATFTLYGAGWGHGVGLCQIGAAVMGEKGYDYRTILSHYFPHTTVTSWY